MTIDRYAGDYLTQREEQDRWQGTAPDPDAEHDAQLARQDRIDEYAGLSECPVCHGDGETQHRGESVNPFNGIPGWDPQADYDEACRRCHGTGAIEPEAA